MSTVIYTVVINGRKVCAEPGHLDHKIGQEVTCVRCTSWRYEQEPTPTHAWAYAMLSSARYATSGEAPVLYNVKGSPTDNKDISIGILSELTYWKTLLEAEMPMIFLRFSKRRRSHKSQELDYVHQADLLRMKQHTDNLFWVMDWVERITESGFVLPDAVESLKEIVSAWKSFLSEMSVNWLYCLNEFREKHPEGNIRAAFISPERVFWGASDSWR